MYYVTRNINENVKIHLNQSIESKIKEYITT